MTRSLQAKLLILSVFIIGALTGAVLTEVYETRVQPSRLPEDATTVRSDRGRRPPNFQRFEDFLNLDLKEINVMTSIGQNIDNRFAYSYVTNPFKVEKYSSVLRTLLNTSMSTANNGILFENNIVNNCLYISFFKNVMNYIEFKADNTNLDVDTTIKLYFPLIAQKDVNTFK